MYIKYESSKVGVVSYTKFPNFGNAILASLSFNFLKQIYPSIYYRMTTDNFIVVCFIVLFIDEFTEDSQIRWPASGSSPLGISDSLASQRKQSFGYLVWCLPSNRKWSIHTVLNMAKYLFFFLKDLSGTIHLLQFLKWTQLL